MTGQSIAMPAALGRQDQDAAERLAAVFDAHHQRLFRLARRLSRSTEDARDLVATDRGSLVNLMEVEPGPHGARPIIDSSFTMDAGETVVVGTSRLGGDKALIALVTAVRKN